MFNVDAILKCKYNVLQAPERNLINEAYARV